MANKVGRKKLFEKGATNLQDFVALALAYGKKPYDIARAKNISYESIKNWKEHPYFQKLVEKYKQEFIKTVKDRGFDDMKFLDDTMVESMKSTAHRADGLRARELKAKLKGEFTPEEITVRVKKELTKLSNKQLEELAKEIEDANNNTTISAGGTSEAEEYERVGEV